MAPKNKKKKSRKGSSEDVEANLKSENVPQDEIDGGTREAGRHEAEEPPSMNQRSWQSMILSETRKSAPAIDELSSQCPAGFSSSSSGSCPMKGYGPDPTVPISMYSSPRAAEPLSSSFWLNLGDLSHRLDEYLESAYPEKDMYPGIKRMDSGEMRSYRVQTRLLGTVALGLGGYAAYNVSSTNWNRAGFAAKTSAQVAAAGGMGFVLAYELYSRLWFKWPSCPRCDDDMYFFVPEFFKHVRNLFQLFEDPTGSPFMQTARDALDGFKTRSLACPAPLNLTPFLLTDDPRNVEHILKTKMKIYDKGPEFRYNLRDILGSGIFNADGEQWLWQRKTASLLFTDRSFRTHLFDVMLRHSETLKKMLLEKVEAKEQHDAGASFLIIGSLRDSNTSGGGSNKNKRDSSSASLAESHYTATGGLSSTEGFASAMEDEANHANGGLSSDSYNIPSPGSNASSPRNREVLLKVPLSPRNKSATIPEDKSTTTGGASSGVRDSTGSSLSKNGDQNDADVVDIYNWFQRFTLDTIGEIGFGENINCLEVGNEHPFLLAFDTAQEAAEGRFYVPFWTIRRAFVSVDKFFNWLMPKVYCKYWLSGWEGHLRDACKVLRNYAGDLVDSRKNEFLARRAAEKEKSSPSGVDSDNEWGITAAKLPGVNSAAKNRNLREETHDFLSLFMRAKPDLSRDMYMDLVLNFLIAGRDTTSQSLAWTIYELLLHPEAMKKVCAEAARVDPYDYDQIEKGMPYTTNVINESLRLHPSVPKDPKYSMQDDTLPDGTFVPRGWYVAVVAYAQGRNNLIWGEDCYDFRPERWDEREKLPTAFENPVFNAGPRLCLGQRMAMTEMRVVLAVLLKDLTFEWACDPGEIHPAKSLTLGMKPGLKVRVGKRNK